MRLEGEGEMVIEIGNVFYQESHLNLRECTRLFGDSAEMIKMMAKGRTVYLVVDKIRKSLKNRGRTVRNGVRKELVMVLETQTKRHLQVKLTFCH